MLETLTFTGVDASTSLADLAAITKRYPRVEFGILAGSHTDSRVDRGIFPSLETVARFKGATGEHGFFAMAPNGGSHGAPPATLELCKGFDRVQVNLHGDYWGDTAILVHGERMAWFAEDITQGSVESVILQHSKSWEDIPIRHPRIEYLFDVSEGGGVYSVHRWPEPPPDLPQDTRLGYSGGLGPENMARAMAFANRYPATRMWMDMEGRVRTEGRFDLAKVREVCALAFPEKEQGGEGNDPPASGLENPAQRPWVLGGRKRFVTHNPDNAKDAAADISLREVMQRILRHAIDKDFRNVEYPVDRDIAHIHREVSEAFEAYRRCGIDQVERAGEVLAG